MTIEPETNNPYDRFACLVKAPAQDHLQGRYIEFSVVAFGRVPKNICNVISVDKRKQILLRARSIYLGHMVHDGQQRGGGPKLVCMYLLEYKNNVNIYEVGNHLRRYVNEDFIFMWICGIEQGIYDFDWTSSSCSLSEMKWLAFKISFIFLFIIFFLFLVIHVYMYMYDSQTYLSIYRQKKYKQILESHFFLLIFLVLF